MCYYYTIIDKGDKIIQNFINNRGIPIVNDDSSTIDEDPDPNSPVYIDFFATDFPAGFSESGSASIALTGPYNGSLIFISKEIIGGFTKKWRYQYQPNLNFNGNLKKLHIRKYLIKKLNKVFD